MKKLTIIISIIILGIHAGAQDIHLSHFDAAPQYLNPALTGMYFGERLDYRFNANYAAQSMASFANLFNTFAAGYDMHIKRFGLGGYLITNQAGEGNYRVMNLFLSAAYEISIDKMYRHNLMTGVQLGMFHNSFNQEKLFFESQYSVASGSFDPTISNGEAFDKTSLWKFDAGWGAFYEFRDRTRTINPFLGLSIFHPTSPNLSYHEGEQSDYPVRFTIYAGNGFNLNETYQISPRMLIFSQGNRQMFDIGVFNYYTPRFSKFGYLAGVLYNSNDVLTAHIGLKAGANIYRFSYGFNTSLINNYSGSRNDFELSIILARKTNSNPSY